MRWFSKAILSESEDLYHGRVELSQSKVKDFMKCPEKFAQLHVHKTEKVEPKSCMEFGKEVHEAVLLRGLMSGFTVIPPEVLSKDGKKAGNTWKEYAAANEGKVLLKLSEAEAFDRVVEALHSHPEARKLFEPSPTAISEMTLLSHVLVGSDQEPVDFKSRIDRMLSPGEIYDLKTTGDMDRLKWVVRDFDWAVQSYVYGAAADAHFGIEGTEVTYIVVETSAPFRVRIWRASKQTLDDAATRTSMAVGEIVKRYQSQDWNSDDWCDIHLF